MAVEKLVLAALLDDAPPGYPTLAENRVYALRLPKNTTFPALSFQRISSEPVNSLDGSSGLDQVRLQVDCWAETYDQAKRLAAEVRDALEAGSFKALLATERDDFEEEARLYRVSSDFMLWQHAVDA